MPALSLSDSRKEWPLAKRGSSRERAPARRQAPVELGRMLAASSELLEHLPIAGCVCDHSGMSGQYNRRAVGIWGRVPAPGELHRTFTARNKFYHADGHPMAPPEIPMARVLNSGEAVREQEITVERPD